MAAFRKAAPQVRSFNVMDELRATADRRKKQPSSATTPAADQFAGQGIPQIAERLAVMFPQLGQDIVHAVLSELFRADSSCSRQQLADTAVAQLLEMSADDGTPHAMTSFEPRFCTDDTAATDNCTAADCTNDGAGPTDGITVTDDDQVAKDDDAVPQNSPDPADASVVADDDDDMVLDSLLAALLSLPDDALRSCARTLESILRRIIEAPEDERYRRLKRSNARFQAEVGSHAPAVELLLFAGFEGETTDAGPSFLFSGDPSASPNFLRVWEALSGLVEDLGLAANTTASGTRAPTPGPDMLPLKQQKFAPEPRRQRIAELTEQRLQNPHAFKQAAQARGSGNRAVGSGHFKHRGLDAPPVQREAQPSRRDQREAQPSRRAQHFTLSDINRMRISDEIANMPNYAEEYRQSVQNTPARDYSTLVARSYDPELIAREALDLTNRYRASKGLAPCRWHEGIARIAAGHAGQMATGTMPFSHDGFNERVRAFPVAHRSAAENLAYNQGMANVAEVAVDGWIKSPGHEKNLRGDFNLCGIGVARSSNGSFYLTQLFAQAR